MARFFLKNSRGSVTVEASIVFPAFLSVFFLLLFLVKFTCTGVLLDYAVNETAKEIATAAYPIAFLNELEDDKLQQYGVPSSPGGEEELKKDYGYTAGNSSEDIISALISGNVGIEDAENLIKGALEGYQKGAVGQLAGEITPAYWDLKAAVKRRIVEAMLREHLDDRLIVPGNIKIRMAELPQSTAEYESRSKSGIYGECGLVPGEDFGRDDVVIQLEYCYTVRLPFVKELDIKMVHTAVEKAWLAGSFGIMTERQEGLELGSDSTIVYVTRTGIRYHLGSCRHLHSSKIPMEISEAKAEGYTPCKVCKPLN